MKISYFPQNLIFYVPVHLVYEFLVKYENFSKIRKFCWSMKFSHFTENGILKYIYIYILSWLKTLHGYPNAIYENLGTSVHADLMVWGEINLLNKGGLKMNLAFLISFMTFHFYLNLAFHANIFTIRIEIVIYFNLKKYID